MSITYSTTIKNTMLQAVAEALDAADPLPAHLQIYSADQPTAGAAITDQTLLADITLNFPCGSVAAGILTLTCPIADDNVPASGTLIWGRLLDGDDNWIADGDVGLEDSGAMIELTSLASFQGGIVRINNAILGLI
ncbi:hypothetical protein KAI46_12780 [bacterium]|nr:hypothetical protein [bacterium]